LQVGGVFIRLHPRFTLDEIALLLEKHRRENRILLGVSGTENSPVLLWGVGTINNVTFFIKPGWILRQDFRFIIGKRLAGRCSA